MPLPIVRQLRAMARQIDRAFGQIAASYQRGDLVCDVRITPTQVGAWLAALEDGINTRVNSTHLLIDPQTIDFGEGPLEPVAGDSIVMEFDRKTYTFECRPEQAGRPCFTYTDPYRVRTRLHVVLTAVD